MYAIVADSSCDMTPELRQALGVVSVPLTLTVCEASYTDDDSLDLVDYMDKVKHCTGRIGSAAPPPGLYRDAFVGHNPSYGITLSSRLSGSFQSAEAGKDLAAEEGAHTHIFDSKSASAGELLAAITLRKLLDKELTEGEVISRMEQFIARMKTYLVLENVDTLQKNGRLGFIAGTIVSILGIKPLLGSDGDGNIILYGKARGTEKALRMMADKVGDSGINTSGQDMVITHCNNPGMARRLEDMIEKAYDFAKIWVVPTRGLSSTYANDRGVIMAF